MLRTDVCLDLDNYDHSLSLIHKVFSHFMILTSGKDKHTGTAIKIYVSLCPLVLQTRVIASLSLDIWLLTVWCGHKRCWWHPDVNDAGDATQKLGWDALILSAERERCQHHSSICIMPSIITFSLIIPRNPISILFTASSSDYHKSPDRDLSDFQTFYHYLLSGWGTKKLFHAFQSNINKYPEVTNIPTLSLFYGDALGLEQSKIGDF